MHWNVCARNLNELSDLLIISTVPLVKMTYIVSLCIQYVPRWHIYGFRVSICIYGVHVFLFYMYNVLTIILWHSSPLRWLSSWNLMICDSVLRRKKSLILIFPPIEHKLILWHYALNLALIKGDNFNTHIVTYTMNFL